MFFILSKVLWFAAAPTNLLLGLAAVGLAARMAGRPRGLRLAAGALGLLMLCGILPVGRLLLRPLEDRFPAPDIARMAPPDGIVVLGGAIDQAIGAARHAVTIGDAATRITAGVVLARRFPSARLVYTGGSNALVAEVGGEAEDAKRLWTDLGVDPARITIETRSRNTDENARFSRDLLQPQPGQRWLLVTSAYHMPRSVGLFREAGFDVLPFPVDYRSTGGVEDLEPTAAIAAGLVRLDTATREWIGLAAYRLSRKTAALFPSP